MKQRKPVIVRSRAGSTCLLLVVAMLSMYPVACEALTVTVTNVNDSGAGSLRQAITDVNASPPPNTINFGIAGSPPFVITPAAALPAVSQTVLIDGTSQPGYAGIPVVVLDGAVIPPAQSGLTVNGNGSTVRGMHIRGFPNNGISLAGASNHVEGCHIISNGVSGIMVYWSSHHRIGGTNATSGNVISGNGEDGVAILDGGGLGASNIVVAGNTIGLSPGGATAMPNGRYGIKLEGATDCLVQGTATARQVISGNTDWGLMITTPWATGNRVFGNYIGTDYAGTTFVPNGAGGVQVRAAYNTIGGTNAGERNVISGNAGIAVRIHSTHDAAVCGNYIGLDATGANGIANSGDGIYLYYSASNRISANFVANNVGDGVHVSGAASTDNVIDGNTLGLTVAGVASGNQSHGVRLNGAPYNTVGGTTVQARNVIAKNGRSGIYIWGATARGNMIRGNWIGIADGGNRGNIEYGIEIDQAPATDIGGSSARFRNVISHNDRSGIKISGSGAVDTVVEGNFIGTDVAGTAAAGNDDHGIEVREAGTTIGGAIGSSGNTISGNTKSGISVEAAAAAGTVIQGNLVGTDRAGTSAVPNRLYGVFLSAPNCIVGGTHTNARNVVSGNRYSGIYVAPGATGTVVRGNYVGTGVAGGSALPNCTHGSEGGITVASGGNTIGGTETVARNVISGNAEAGIRVDGSNAVHNAITGNYIGLNAQGDGAVPNATYGVALAGAVSNTIGGLTLSARNVISGNGSAGIGMFNSGAERNLVVGNVIGLNAPGTATVPNGTDGIVIAGVASNTVGGTVPGSRNIISGNLSDGVTLLNGAAHNVVLGNTIGMDESGTVPRGNQLAGVRIASASSNTIGGISFVAGNRIAHNQCGVVVTDSTGPATGNMIVGNQIYANGCGSQIDLGNDGVTPNDGAGDLDSGPNGLVNHPSITNALSGSTLVQGALVGEYSQTFRIDVYATPAAVFAGKYYLGGTNVTVGVSGSVDFSFSVPGTAPVGWWVCATATRVLDGSTSEFGTGVQVSAATDTDGDGMPDEWETNNGLSAVVSNAPSADADSDGVTDVHEYYCDTSPTNGSSYLRITSISGGNGVTVVVPSSVSRYYALDYNMNLVSGLWENVSQDTQGNDGDLLMIDPNATNEFRAYRVRASIP